MKLLGPLCEALTITNFGIPAMADAARGKRPSLMSITCISASQDL